ncbi:hypothetical protein D9619_007052 [Psilocybe cf. subviscida]|uniref:Uncharacterized protein n=1 Tax=Psilocybe cf. subviscida TaxID=2480587 RepID=A0A8H5EX09_9AGAR|nr:hypothetical protein D9619_007052 [Psilocybe cf. subviscida]
MTVPSTQSSDYALLYAHYDTRPLKRAKDDDDRDSMGSSNHREYQRMDSSEVRAAGIAVVLHGGDVGVDVPTPDDVDPVLRGRISHQEHQSDVSSVVLDAQGDQGVVVYPTMQFH